MNLNVFHWVYKLSYYLTHPWLWIKEFIRNCRAAYHRIKFGWCYADCWKLGYWLLEILPPMLRHMADYGHSYPGREPFDTPEKWHDWLHKMANDITYLQEENVEGRNEYNEAFENSFKMKLQPSDKHLTCTWECAPDHEKISKLYIERLNELYQQREELLIKVFTELAKNIPTLWD